MRNENRKEGYYQVRNNDEGKTPMIAEWDYGNWYVAGLDTAFKDSDFSYISPTPIDMEQESTTNDLPSVEVSEFEIKMLCATVLQDAFVDWFLENPTNKVDEAYMAGASYVLTHTKL